MSWRWWLSRPQIAREHILRAAARQFEEGDVQHWWLPTSGQGVRTRISDNRIWLPFVAAHYLEVTEDFAVLDEQLPFLTGAPLADGSAGELLRSGINQRHGRPVRTLRPRPQCRVWRSVRTVCRCSAPAIGTTA